MGVEGICFPAEKADKVTLEENGIDEVRGRVGLVLPHAYSAVPSEFVFTAGVRLAQTRNSNGCICRLPTEASDLISLESRMQKRVAIDFTDLVAEPTHALSFGAPFETSNQMGAIIDVGTCRFSKHA